MRMIAADRIRQLERRAAVVRRHIVSVAAAQSVIAAPASQLVGTVIALQFVRHRPAAQEIPSFSAVELRRDAYVRRQFDHIAVQRGPSDDERRSREAVGLFHERDPDAVSVVALRDAVSVVALRDAVSDDVPGSPSRSA